MSNWLEELKKHTVVVADTGDFAQIQQYAPRDATTNPSLLSAAAQMATYDDVVEGALRAARDHLGPSTKSQAVVAHAIDRLSVAFGLRILAIVPGRVSTEVDARLSFDTDATVRKAREIIAMYEAAGAPRDRILIKIASTWEGIRAAEILEREGIHCNLTLLFGLHQAIACAEAGVTLISPFVGRILDYYKKKNNRDYAPAEDPGVLSVTDIYNYLKKFDHKTEVMGASFRNVGEITELCGCDLLTISPKLLGELAEQQGVLPRKLSPEHAKTLDIQRIEISEGSFRTMHEADEMASFKLSEGIASFTDAIVSLERLLEERLAALDGAPSRAAG